MLGLFTRSPLPIRLFIHDWLYFEIAPAAVAVGRFRSFAESFYGMLIVASACGQRGRKMESAKKRRM